MKTDAPWPAQALDQPLPLELTGRRHSRATRYRMYPVYSPPWVRGRLMWWGGGVLCFVLFVVLAVAVAPLNDRPFGGLVKLVIDLSVPVVLGPWLAGRVRAEAWSAQREWRALCAVMVAVVLILGAFTYFLGEPLKQWVAEQVGAVDADGKRKRVSIAVGISIQEPSAASAPGPSVASAPQPPGQGLGPQQLQDAEHTPLVVAINLVAWGLTTFVLAGGLGLWSWRREREGLAALQRERELSQARAERREVELRLSVLAAQVEPHFLFNTLAGVRSAISTDPARATDMIDHLVDYLRASIPHLRSDGSAQATLGGQFDILRAYLGLMAARLPRLKFTVEAPADLLAAPCPPWMLISLVENAVKHGIELKVGAARIDVSAQRNPAGGIDITVADDGVGFGQSASGTGLGLSNIRERLQQLYRGQATLSLKARAQGGVAATLSLPPEESMC